MPNPSMNSTHIDVPLSNISVAFMQLQEGFVANKIFPLINVSKASDKFWKYPREYWNRVEMKPRAPGTESAGGEYKVTYDSYVTEMFALHKDIADEEVYNADDHFNLSQEAAQWLALQQLLFTEKKWFDEFFKTGVWAVDTTGAAQLGGLLTSPTSKPIAGLKDVVRDMQQKTAGYKPNTVVLGARVWDAITENDDFLSRVLGGSNSVSPATVTKDMLSAALGGVRILVSEGVVNTANEGAAENNVFIGADSILVCHSASRPGKKTPSCGYTFNWTMPGNDIEGTSVRRLRMEPIRAERIEISSSFAHKVIAPELGTFIHTVI
jgi:hypothetical protein